MAANGAADGARGGRAVLWFRNDLRTHDNAIVAEAARRAKAGQINEVGSIAGLGEPFCRVLLFECWMAVPDVYSISMTSYLGA